MKRSLLVVAAFIAGGVAGCLVRPWLATAYHAADERKPLTQPVELHAYRVPSFVEAARQNPSPSTLLLGDSITDGWRDNPGLLPSDVLNLGVGGYHVENVLWLVRESDFAKVKIAPSRIVLLVGTNNVGRGDSPEDVADAVRQLVVDLRLKYPAAKVVVVGLLPRGRLASDPIRSQITAVNRVLVGAAEHDRYTYLDAGPALLDPSGSLVAAVSPDALHLSPEGYRRLAAVLR